MSIKKIFTKENFILLLSILGLTIAIFSEFSYKKNIFFNEKIYDLTLQYNDKVIANKKISEALFDDVLENKNIISLINDANKNINKDSNRDILYNMLKNKYKRMKEKGILQFHFHLANGESFLRFHKPKKYGDSLLFRESIRQVIHKQKVIYGFEVGRHF